jgi:YjbE family integral membrane protein
MSLDLLSSILSIVVIDLVLSGDNALVIGMASSRLPRQQRRWAILAGGAGAIALRIGFTALAAYLLSVPLLQAAGGILLTFIAYRLLSQEGETREVEAAGSFGTAVRTIIVADAVMSLDNMLAVGGASHGSIELLLFGLGLSMPLILFGSSLIARLLNRLPWLMVIGVVVLTITAARMIVDDRIVGGLIADEVHSFALIALAIVLTLVVLVPALHRWREARRRLTAEQPEPPGAPVEQRSSQSLP